MAVGSLDFEVPDVERYPCLQLAYAAWRSGGTAPVILNAANEMAVQAFLDRRIPFTAIHRIIEQTLERCTVDEAASLEIICNADAAARQVAVGSIRSGPGVAVR